MAVGTALRERREGKGREIQRDKARDRDTERAGGRKGKRERKCPN